MAKAEQTTIEIEDLEKVFTGPRPLRQIVRQPLARRKVAALSGISFKAFPKEVIGLIGPNGAGKTTLIKILAGMIMPNSGSATLLGLPAGSKKARALVGLVTAEERSFFWRISAHENLRFFAALHGLDKEAADRRIFSLAAKLELEKVLSRPVRELSSGNRGRLALARGMLHNPRLLLLDEVARALDPGAARKLRATLRRLADETAITIIYAIHDLFEVRRLCDRVILMNAGSIAAFGTFDEISAKAKEIFELDHEDFPFDYDSAPFSL